MAAAAATPLSSLYGQHRVTATASAAARTRTCPGLRQQKQQRVTVGPPLSRRRCTRSGSLQEEASATAVSTDDDDGDATATAPAAAAKSIRERGLQLPSYPEADLAAALEELKALEGMREGHADDATMRWFLKDRGLEVEEAAEKVRKYNAWRVENGYESIAFDTVREEYETGKAVLLDERARGKGG